MSLAEEARAVRQRIAERLAELEPLVREYNELVKLAGEMGVEQPQEDEPTVAAGKPRGSDSTRTARRGGRRANTGGSRAARSKAGDEVGALVLEAVRADPGKTVADYAELLNMSATALYRPVRQLTDQGMLVKRVRQLFPA